MSASALTQAVAAVDREVATWLEATADHLEQDNLAWINQELTSSDRLRGFDAAIFEMRQVASILRTRPISTKAGQR